MFVNYFANALAFPMHAMTSFPHDCPTDYSKNESRSTGQLLRRAMS